MSSLHPNYLERLRFHPHHARALVSLGKRLGTQGLYVAQKPAVLDTLRQTAIIASTISSNRLEGIEVEEDRIGELMQPMARPRTRSEQEVAGYRQALELIHDSYEHMPIRATTLLQLHKLLYRYHPATGGRFKANNNTIVEVSPDGARRIRFQPTSALATPAAIEAMCARFVDARQDERYEALVLAPLLVLDFLCIHPFGDGNGRISRLLTLLLLYQAGHEVGRYISLERITEDTKLGYYEALERSSHGWHEGEHDVLPWLEYFWGVLEAAYAEFEERVEALLDASLTKAERVELIALSYTMPFKLADLRERLVDVSDATITKALRDMKARGLLTLKGKGRGASWEVKPRSDEEI